MYQATHIKILAFPEAFDWLALAIQISKSGKPTEAIQRELETTPLDPRLANHDHAEIRLLLTRTETDIGVEEFIDKFRSSVCPAGTITLTSVSRTCI